MRRHPLGPVLLAAALPLALIAMPAPGRATAGTAPSAKPAAHTLADGEFEPVTIVSDDFEDGTTQGWAPRGSAVLTVSAPAAHGGAAGLRTTGRTATWHGPSLELADRLVTGATYTVSGYARLVAGQAPATLAVTMQRTPTGGTTTWDRVTSAAATDAAWVRLLGEYTVPSDSSQLQLYLESDSATAEYDLDDVQVVMITPPPDGPPTEAGVRSTFEGGTTQGWAARTGVEQLSVSSATAHSGEFSLLTEGRAQAYGGPALSLLSRVAKGSRYTFSVWLRMAGGQPDSQLRLSLERRTGGVPSYQTLAGAQTVTDAEWVRFTASYVLAYDVDFLSVYVESASGTASFHMDDFELAYVVPVPIQTDIPALSDVLAEDFPIGAAVEPAQLVGVHGELLERHFNSLTAGNQMKWDATEPAEGQFQFTDADLVVAFAREHGTALRGHTLVWHNQVPAWVFTRPDGTTMGATAEDKALLLARLENHIRAVAGRYAADVSAWDVVNEVVDETQPDGLRHSRWYEIAGLDYIRTAFRVAREVAPGAALCLNDYNTEYPAKRRAVYNLVARLRAERVPVDCVGHQLHINIAAPEASEIDQTLCTFARLGVQQQVTELDMSVYTNDTDRYETVPPEVIVEQGYRYRDVFDVLRRNRSRLTSVTLWGLADDDTWLSTFPITRRNAPLLFDEQLQAKPAYWGVVDPSQLPPRPAA